jgi:hypothetical protein
MRTFIGANGVPLSTNASQTFFKKVDKFLPYFTDNEFDQVDKILKAIQKRTTQNNKNAVFRYIRNLRRNIMNARSNPFRQISQNTRNTNATNNRQNMKRKLTNRNTNNNQQTAKWRRT